MRDCYKMNDLMQSGVSCRYMLVMGTDFCKVSHSVQLTVFPLLELLRTDVKLPELDGIV